MGASAPVAIIMGSRSDWPTLKAAAEILDALGVAHEDKVVSAHRTPDRMYAFARSAREYSPRLEWDVKSSRGVVTTVTTDCAYRGFARLES